MARTVDELRRLVRRVVADEARMAAELLRLADHGDGTHYSVTRTVYQMRSNDHLAQMLAEVSEFVDAQQSGPSV